MKTLLATLLGAATCLASRADTTNLTATGLGGVSYVVPTGVVAHVTYAVCSAGSAGMYVGIGSNSSMVANAAANTGYGLFNAIYYPTVVGPATIGVTNVSGGVTAYSLLVIQTSPAVPVPAVQSPSTAVVIPNDANGPVTIILESSTDLVSWTAALPGTYGTTATNRFFRVRASR